MDETVGSFTFSNNTIYNEMLRSFRTYITAENLYEMDIRDTTITNFLNDLSSKEITLFLYLKSLKLNIEGNVTITSVDCNNCSFQFLLLESVDGSATTTNNVIIKNIMMRNSIFYTRNSLMTFGPLFTKQDVQISITDSLFENLNFIRGANMIHVYLQTESPFIISSCVFQNIFGGYIKLDTLTTIPGSFPASLYGYNITAVDNDFMDKTLFVLGQFCEINIYK